jgi:hypothetical protein
MVYCHHVDQYLQIHKEPPRTNHHVPKLSTSGLSSPTIFDLRRLPHPSILMDGGEEREEIRKVQEKNSTKRECKEISSTAYGSQSKCEHY